jgi:flagellar motor switch protein FliN
VIALDPLVDEPVELLVGSRVIARGEVVVVDGNYGFRVTKVVSAEDGVQPVQNG